MNKSVYKEIGINNFEEILTLIKKFENLELFRGQANSKWTLLPKLPRAFGLQPPDNWKNLEYFMIEQFRQYSIPYIDKEPINDLEWLVLSQHYGLPTRLLDWTTNPLKAIFFAEKQNGADDRI